MLKLKPNVGILGALIRITLGLTLLSCSTAKMVRRPYRMSYWSLAFLGAMHVAEGIVRYCPLTALYQQTSMPNMVKKMTNDHDESSDFSEKLPES
ncbi:YgaP family membrane protein [Niallia sp. Krafla_26]|uniref:YgaP family membrane protein n=1 Tax=Niallia sp. Krafla_26 TaxID=3064703 RepID=UPI003D184D61